MLVDGVIEVAFLFAPEAKDLVHIPPPPQLSPMAMTRLSQLRPKGLHSVEHCAFRDINVPLRQELHDMGGRQRIAGIPANGGEDHVSRPGSCTCPVRINKTDLSGAVNVA
jgi:hypothetical protein